MVGTITVVSQEAAQVLESAGEGPLGKSIVAYGIEFLRALFPLVHSECDLYLQVQAPVVLLEYMLTQLSGLILIFCLF